MTTDQATIKDLFRRYYDAYNARDIHQLDALWDQTYAPDVILHDPTLPLVADSPDGATQAVKAFIRQIFHDFSDIQIELDDIFGEGDRIVVRDHFLGTRISDGKRMSVQTLSISRLANGKIVECWQLTDTSFEGQPRDSGA